MSRATIGVPMKSRPCGRRLSSSVTASLAIASMSMSTTGRVMPMMAEREADPPAPGRERCLEAHSRSAAGDLAGGRRSSADRVVHGPSSPVRRATAVAAPCAEHRRAPRSGAGGRAAGAEPSSVEVVRRLGHPLVDEAREHRAGDDDRRDRDEDAEDQGAAEVGVEQPDRGQRTGVRRHQPVQHRQAGQRRDADLHQRQPGALGHEDDDRHEQHDADLEEQRQAEDGRDGGHHPRQAARPDPADQRRDDAVGAAGVLEQLADHRPERDEHADRAGGRAEARR